MPEIGRRIATIFIWTVALFYAYGALVHVLNMANLSGFDWGAAPRKWQALDLIYLIVDVVVVFGLMLRWRLGFVAFYLAAISQIVLYTLLRPWVLDVPPEFAVSESEQQYLTVLVVFHAVTLTAMTLLGRYWRRPPTSARR